MTRARLPLVLLILLAAAEPVLAHDQQGTARGFLTGFLHPLSGADHVLAMIAVGLWGAQLGAPGSASTKTGPSGSEADLWRNRC